MIKIAFAGNPNVGKSALINAIAGSHLTVGNWPGVTVEKKEATFEFKGEKIKLIDLPGVYSLSPYSLEEKITRDYILDENPDVVINVVDSTNLDRNLYLTYLIKELGKPTIMALNFYDEFDKLNYNLDITTFSEMIELQAMPVSAVKKTGINNLLTRAIEFAKMKKENNYTIIFDDTITDLVKKIQKDIDRNPKFTKVLEKYSSQFLAIKFMERDKHILEKLKNNYGIDTTKFYESEIVKIEDEYDNDMETILAEERYGKVNEVLDKTFRTKEKNRLDFSDKVDKIVLNRILGIPIFIIIIAGLMALVFNGSAPFVDWVDGFFNDFIAKYVQLLVVGTPDWVHSLVIDGIIGGVGSVLTFIPVMLFLYFFLAILEESGYMARVAFLMDRIMRSIGLNGRAFVPMVVGFGCTVPAIYASRTLEDETSRKLTATMTPFMSCGARLPVYGLFTAAFFGAKGGMIVVSLYLLGIVVAIGVGSILKRFKEFKVNEKAFLIELPPYRIPSFKVILNSTNRRIWAYIKKAGTVILAIMLILWGLTYFPAHGDEKNSYMAKFGHEFAYIMHPTGFGDKWELVAAIPPSIGAKEVVVGFLGQVLTKSTDIQTEPKNEDYDFGKDFFTQMRSFGSAVEDSIKSMLIMDVSFSLDNLDDSQIVNNNNKSCENGIVDATKKLWKNDPLAPLRAYSFMVFILLVIPCVATLGAIKQEFGWKFLGKIVGIMIVVPYVVSTIIFQIGKLFY